MDRVVVTARLTPGSEERARELIAGGPPFDPRDVRLVRHTVYASSDLVVFVFEGHDLELGLRALVNDQLQSASFGAWGPLLAEEPKVAYSAYHWEQGEPDEEDP